MTFISRPDRDRWDRDPIYIRNRAIIRAQRRPCARCGGAIDYENPYWITRNGKRTINLRAFHCGHKVSRINGGTHDLDNLQAEHAGCSIRAGARLGRQRVNGHTIPAASSAQTSMRPKTAERW